MKVIVHEALTKAFNKKQIEALRLLSNEAVNDAVWTESQLRLKEKTNAENEKYDKRIAWLHRIKTAVYYTVVFLAGVILDYLMRY